ncbi:MAG: BON domain-containing protein [Pseudomonadales bacterium]
MILSLTACVFSNDPRTRTPGKALDDQFLERVVERDIRASNAEFKGTNVHVVSFNGLVLLLGQVSSEQLREQAGTVAGAINRVRAVHNELSIGGPISYPARSNDAYITTKVKAKMAADKETPASRVKVVTENGVVYLMGMLPRAEADKAVQVASTVYGIQKIVKVFEYLDG